MANFIIPDTLDFSTSLRKLEAADPASYAVFNELLARLIVNDAYLEATKMVGGLNEATNNDLDALIKSGDHFKSFTTLPNTIGTPFMEDGTRSAVYCGFSLGTATQGMQFAMGMDGTLFTRHYSFETLSKWTEFFTAKGGTISGNVILKKTADSIGQTLMYKNHTTEYDNGTILQDHNGSGSVELKISASDNSVTFTDKDYKEHNLLDKAPAHYCGTSDLTAGSTSLDTGRLYIVYE